MKALIRRIHGYLDDVAVIALLLTAALLNATALSYVLAATLLLLSILFAIWMLTDYRAAETHRDIGRHVMHR